jgi:hypothetical protein
VRTARTAAITITAVTALFNLPTALTAGPSQLPTALAWLFTAFGAAGVFVLVAMTRRALWARDAVVAVGTLNVVGGVAAIIAGNMVGLAAVVLGVAAVASGLRAGGPHHKPTLAH